MALDGPTYILPEISGPLRQGEILSSVLQYRVVVNYEDVHSAPTITVTPHSFVIVLTQDCDLAQDFSGRASVPKVEKQMVSNVMLCEVDIANNMRAKLSAGSDIWKRIIQNKDDRFQYLSAITEAEDRERAGIDPLLIDFKRVFTLPTDMLYKQLENTSKRRCSLISPYLEHLSSRYAFFLSRVALPKDHHL